VQYSKFLFTSFIADNKAYILYRISLARNDARDATRSVNTAFHTAFLARFRKISDRRFSVKYGFINKSGIYEARAT